MAAGSVHCVVTSPPYYGLRDYGVAGQLGLEASPAEYIAEMVAVFRAARRVLRDGGTLWLNCGDAFINKQLQMMPARVALALQADGWWLRSDIIWAKPNPMPESVTDRPTSAHEHIFLLAKSPTYFYDADAVAEPSIRAGDIPGGQGGYIDLNIGHYKSGLQAAGQRPVAATRNLRNLWTIPTEAYPEAHFATFPTELAERCIKAGTSERGVCTECGAPWVRQMERQPTGTFQKMADGWDTGAGAHGTIHREGREAGATAVPVMASITTGWLPSCSCNAAVVPATVLDPFAGAGTTLLVADRLQRHAIGIELNPNYCAMIRRRLRDDAPLFAEVAD